MIPYLNVPDIPLPVNLRLPAAPILVILGVVLGSWFVWSRGRAAGISEKELCRAMFWALGAGFVGAHIVAIGVYSPQLLARKPLFLLMVWQGLSSFGGFAGGLAGIAIAFRGRRERRLDLADILMQALVLGWIFGRLGCTIAHDHSGPLTSFFLGIRYPGGTRHDLGFYEFLFTALVLFPAVRIVAGHRVRPGTCLIVVALCYSPFRFACDFLRTADTRYWDLTPAQYGSIALFCYGIHMLWHLIRLTAAPTERGVGVCT